MIHIGWPQGIILGILFLSLLVTAMKDGEPREGKYSLSIRMLDVMIVLGLLIWGGFFR